MTYNPWPQLPSHFALSAHTSSHMNAPPVVPSNSTYGWEIESVHPDVATLIQTAPPCVGFRPRTESTAFSVMPSTLYLTSWYVVEAVFPFDAHPVLECVDMSTGSVVHSQIQVLSKDPRKLRVQVRLSIRSNLEGDDNKYYFILTAISRQNVTALARVRSPAFTARARKPTIKESTVAPCRKRSRSDGGALEYGFPSHVTAPTAKTSNAAPFTPALCRAIAAVEALGGEERKLFLQYLMNSTMAVGSSDTESSVSGSPVYSPAGSQSDATQAMSPIGAIAGFIKSERSCKVEETPCVIFAQPAVVPPTTNQSIRPTSSSVTQFPVVLPAPQHAMVANTTPHPHSHSHSPPSLSTPLVQPQFTYTPTPVWPQDSVATTAHNTQADAYGHTSHSYVHPGTCDSFSTPCPVTTVGTPLSPVTPTRASCGSGSDIFDDSLFAEGTLEDWGDDTSCDAPFFQLC